MKPDSTDPTLARARNAYDLAWNSPEAVELDLGSRPELDEIHAAAVEADEFRSVLTSEHRLTVVDLGAGRGSRLVRHLAVAKPRVVAVDFFPTFARLPLAYPGFKVLSDARAVGLATGAADLVISAWLTLRNPLFLEPGAAASFIGEIVRLLRPGGLFWGEEPGLSPADFDAIPGIMDYYCLKRFAIHSFQRV
jgi:SAM-dependent methyltransferase